MDHQKKFYSFLDVTVDVFYSIILYNAFIAFPGWNKITSLLAILSMWMMVDYWWAVRSDPNYPKYYLFDFYFMTFIMFLFSQWPLYYQNLRYFLLFLSAFWLLDAVYAFLAIYLHKEKIDEPSSFFYCFSETILAVVYFCIYLLNPPLNIYTILLLCVPYIIYCFFERRRGLFKNVFTNTENQPY